MFKPKQHTIFWVINLVMFFVVLGGWLIYRVLTDNYAVAGF
jgi:hypothetical protein